MSQTPPQQQSSSSQPPLPPSSVSTATSTTIQQPPNNLERLTQYLQDGSSKPKLVRASSLQNLPSTSRQPADHLHNTIIAHNLGRDIAGGTSSNNILSDKMDLIKFGEIADHPAPSSKYDFVKVKVRLEDHYYVLSRFLISRVLNVTKVDAADSVKISLELKKRLVDQGRLQISQAELENELFTLLQAYGYGNEYIERYRMTTQFHHQRVPLIILISGPKCIGKSYLATQLAERLNLSTVLQTTLVQDLMHAIITELAQNGDNNGTTPSTSSKGPTMFGMPSDPPYIFKKYQNKDELLSEFKKECVMIRHGVDTDIEKCFDEGKAIIIEGPHIDPALFTELIAERNMFAPIQINFGDSLLQDVDPKNNSNCDINSVNNNNNNNNSNSINNSNNQHGKSQSIDIVTKQLSSSQPQSISSPTTSSVQNSIQTPNLSSSASAIPTSSPSSFKDGIPLSPSQSALEKLKKPKIKGIIIPFVLSVNERDHMFLVENWLSCNPIGRRYASEAFGDDPAEQCRGIVKNLQIIQEYLCQGVPPFQSVEVNPHSLLETLDSLHSAVLKRINKAYSGHVKGFEYE